MGKGYSCSYLVLSPCNCNYIHTLQHSQYMARQRSLQIRKLYQIKTLLYTQLSHHACLTCKVNGFVQIRAVHSRAGPTSRVTSPTKRGSRAARLCCTNAACTAF